ncbi:polysaccharide deacetylase family protein [Hymenobacter bucti]|uniref:Polysaccharide deacetylase family protein n=1 Tax=Hymenobacter bucti TaxID=1844114 RepID=A0ABW4QUA6_9BACT
MRARLKRLARALGWPAPAQACVLMYHRVAELPTDVWRIAVSPAHFEQHLQVLRASYTVLPLTELAEAVARRAVPRRAVSITFDDGYADNFSQAYPLLERYQLPATFFIASGNIGQATEFWWDELEHLLLFTPDLPATFTSTVAGQPVSAALADEAHLSPALRQQHQRWNACTETPPTRRATLFLQLWQLLRPLPHPAQQQHLQQLRQWAGQPPGTRATYRSMAAEQLRELAGSPRHTLGVHTVSHPALAFHAPAAQQRELVENKEFLAQLTGHAPTLVAYPYGNYNPDTLAAAAAAGLRAGFTTEEQPLTNRSERYRLGRFQVADGPGADFARQLQRWQQPS